MQPLDEEENDEADIVVTAGKVSLICPLTQTPFIDPVLNPRCKHSYSALAIRSHLRNTARHTSNNCPVSGCSQSVSLSELVPNQELARRMMRQKDRLFI